MRGCVPDILKEIEEVSELFSCPSTAALANFPCKRVAPEFHSRPGRGSTSSSESVEMVVLGQATGANHVSTDDLITSQSLFHCSRRTILALSAASKRIRYVNDFFSIFCEI